jgi:hypothetical protein
VAQDGGYGRDRVVQLGYRGFDHELNLVHATDGGIAKIFLYRNTSIVVTPVTSGQVAGTGWSGSITRIVDVASVAGDYIRVELNSGATRAGHASDFRTMVNITKLG